MTEARHQLADTQAQLAEARQRIVERQDIIADLLDSVSEERRRADAAEARLEAVKALFGGGPDTSCRTVWQDGIECVSVPLDDLAAALSVAS